MMKNRRNIHIIKYILFGCIALSCVAACSDDDLFTRRQLQYDTDALLFEAYIGKTNVATRAEDTQEELDPLVLEGGDKPLYLHTYVCDQSFNPVENPESDTVAATRGLQVNSIADFIEVYQNFGVQARYTKNFDDEYISPISTVKISQSAADAAVDCAVWRVDGNKVYWPGDNAMLSIHAWAPATLPLVLTNLEKAPGQVKFSYEAQRSADGKTDAEAQTDLLWAVVDCNKKMAIEDAALDAYKAAKLQFTHPLSAIKFEVRDVLGGTIKSISIKNVLTKGNCIYQLTANNDGEYVDTQNGVYTWSDQNTVGDFHQDFNVTVNGQTQRPTDVNATNSVADESVTAKKPKATFMMIPQKISEDAEIEIVMVQTGRKNADGTAAPDQEVTLSGKILDNEVKEWLPGKEYVYTISTNSANWTYVFDVKGSYRNNTEIYMPCPADVEDENGFYANGANQGYVPYFEVKSYRYRSNNPAITEPLPWKAEHSIGVQSFYTIGDNNELVYKTFAEKDAVLYQNRIKEPSERDPIPASEWFKDLNKVNGYVWETDANNDDLRRLKGNGGTNYEKHELSFHDAIVTTDWAGDIAMYKKEPYSGNSESNPWDLSTFGGQRSRNTANCYVVDREGWYSIPLYYGNAITNGVSTSSAWISNLQDSYYDYSSDHYCYKALTKFKDHRGEELNESATGEIPENYYNSASARLLWQDAYDAIDSVRLDKENKRIVFHVNRDNIQQGNAVIGLSEHTMNSWDPKEPKIVWSWHIWINEHWLNDNGISNAFASTGFNTSTNDTSGMQEQGDLLVTVPQNGSKNYEYSVAPYNIGWCDAKNVRYLSRYDVMQFVQYEKDWNTSEYTKVGSLPIIQDGRTIQYKYGNTTYYQFGRKDPFVGFLNHESTLKDDYGDLVNAISPQLKTLSFSIQHPNQLFVGAVTHDNNYYYHDWCDDGWGKEPLTEYYNLWNTKEYNKNTAIGSNNLQEEEYFTYGKTIYDPSPAGYVVPPVGFYKILFTEDPNINNSYQISDLNLSSLESKLNGTRIDDFTYRIYTKRSINSSPYFTLTANGNRWWAKKTGTLPGPGENFNGHICYLWTNGVTKINKDRSAYGIALGNDQQGDEKYIISATFAGRKSMGRAIRPIRENNAVRE